MQILGKNFDAQSDQKRNFVLLPKCFKWLAPHQTFVKSETKETIFIAQLSIFHPWMTDFSAKLTNFSVIPYLSCHVASLNTKQIGKTCVVVVWATIRYRQFYTINWTN